MLACQARLGVRSAGCELLKLTICREAVLRAGAREVEGAARLRRSRLRHSYADGRQAQDRYESDAHAHQKR